MRRRWEAGCYSGTMVVPFEDGVTQEDRPSARLEKCVQAARMLSRKSPAAKSPSGDGERNLSSEAADFTLSRKASNEGQT